MWLTRMQYVVLCFGMSVFIVTVSMWTLEVDVLWREYGVGREAVRHSHVFERDYKDGWKLIHVYVGPPNVSASSGAWKSHSQVHQDTIVRAMIPGKGYFIDLAANDYKFLSNSYSLETFERWEGVCIEANREYLEGHLGRSCHLVSAVVADSPDKKVSFALSGVLGGILGEHMDNTPSSNGTIKSIREFYTQTPEHIFRRLSVPRVVHYLSLDVEGAEDLILPHLPFNKHTFYVLTVERPGEVGLKVLSLHGYVEVGILGNFGDTCYLHTSTPNFAKVLRKGQEEITRITFSLK